MYEVFSLHYEIALRVESAVDSTFKDVLSKGAVPVMELSRMKWGQYISYISDPEGNLIEISA
ncbi:MAG: hypothetical protein K2H13_07405 [Eubacterium sp.]|nr:hypothetical protein [Eubacterium sp.]MDE6156124.1 hypothetical protein [Eubacterium sp.]